MGRAVIHLQENKAKGRGKHVSDNVLDVWARIGQGSCLMGNSDYSLMRMITDSVSWKEPITHQTKFVSFMHYWTPNLHANYGHDYTDVIHLGRA